MKKRILSILLTLCIMICLVPTGVFAEGEAYNCKHVNFDQSTGGCKVSGCKGQAMGGIFMEASFGSGTNYYYTVAEFMAAANKSFGAAYRYCDIKFYLGTAETLTLDVVNIPVRSLFVANGNTVGGVVLCNGQDVTITGGRFDKVTVKSGCKLTVTGGSIGLLTAESGSTVDLRDSADIDKLDVKNGSNVTINTVKEVKDAKSIEAALKNNTVSTVKLTENITMDSTLAIERAVKLDLNGYVLKNESNTAVSSLGSGNLTIVDSNSNARHKFTFGSNGLWVLDEQNGIMTVKGGIIIGFCNDYDSGGGITVSGGKVVMNAGNIFGCKSNYGGGVYVGRDGTFTMTGGSIFGCTANEGSAVYLTGGTMNANGGTVNGTVMVDYNNMNNRGGVIQSDGSSGVTEFKQAVNNVGEIKHGTFFGTVTLGNAIFSGKITDGTFNGPVTTASEGEADISSGTFNNTVTINRGKITNGTFNRDVVVDNAQASFSCTTLTGGTYNGLIINKSAYAAFIGAHSPLGIVGEKPAGANGHIYHKVTFALNGGSMDYSERYFRDKMLVSDKIKPTRDGYTFSGWYKEDGTKWNHANDTVTDNIILTAKWNPIALGISVVDKNGAEVVINEANKDDVLGDGSVKFAYDKTAKKGTLTLDNANLSSDSTYPINADGIETLEIVLKGNNKVFAEGDVCIVANALIFSGNGSIEIAVGDYAIGTPAIDCYNSFTVNGGDVKVVGKDYSVYADETVAVNGGTLTLIATDSFGKALDSFADPMIKLADDRVMIAGEKSDGSNAVFTVAGDDYSISAARFIYVGVKHSHCQCGGNSMEDGHNHTNEEWLPWASVNSLPTNGGNYYLVNDIVLTSKQVINTNVNICFNDKKVSVKESALNAGDNMLCIGENYSASVTLTDCGTGGALGTSNSEYAVCVRNESKLIVCSEVAVNGEVVVSNSKLVMKYKAKVNSIVWKELTDKSTITLLDKSFVRGNVTVCVAEDNVTTRLTVQDRAKIFGNLSFDVTQSKGSKIILSGAPITIGGNMELANTSSNADSFIVESEDNVSVEGDINMPNITMNGKFVCSGEIKDGIFNGLVVNNGKITGGIFYDTVFGTANIADSAKRTVTFNSNGGSAVNAQKILRGQKAKTPSACKKTGYTFNGWNNGSTVYDFDTPVLEDITLTAQWQVNQYKITVKPENGEADIVIKQDFGTAVTAPILTRKGYAFDGWDSIFPTTMPAEDITIKALWKDVEKPTGKIEIGENSWKSFLNNITFGLFFKGTQTVTVIATDNSGETVKIEYLLSNKELTLADLKNKTFTAYNGQFNINPDNEYIIYVKLTDKAGNTDYICSDGIVLDETKPVIVGIDEGTTYCESQTVTINENYIDTVKVNGTKVKLDKNNRFVLEPKDGKQQIVVTDKAGNETVMTVTVNDGHTFGEWVSNGDGTHTRKCTVSGCTDGIETENCSGGKATCKDKAECKLCGTSYGKTDPNNHADIKHIDAKAATKEADGNIEYWHCEICDKYYSDAAATKEISKADTVTERLKEETKSPKTGDSNEFALWIALLFISGGVVIGVTVISKKKKRSVRK